MTEPRPLGVRAAAAGAALALAFGLPLCIALLAVVDENWRPLVSALAVMFVAVPIVVWFVSRSQAKRREAALGLPDEPAD